MTGRILHLGVGNFHRAHQAWYTQAARGWQITGVSLRSPALRDKLQGQGFDYTLALKDARGTRLERITVLDDILFADDPAGIKAAGHQADIIMLTVTEKGYHLGPDGQLDLEAPAIKADLSGDTHTIYPFLLGALEGRDKPVTILSCDNLTANGDSLRAALSRFAQACGKALTAEVRFPNAMVDRITPATTDALREEVAKGGMACAAPVETEVFTEWVIEDDFAGPRPAWEVAGAQIVPDAAPYEMRKLRMLNGAHSALAYAGLLKGQDYIHQAVADPELRALINGVFDEASATLPAPVETDSYRAALLDRFANPALKHSLRQIAMDGSLKLPVRLIGTISDLNGATPHCRKAVAAWMQFVQQEVAQGRALDDPKATQISAACAGDDPENALARIIGYSA